MHASDRQFARIDQDTIPEIALLPVPIVLPAAQLLFECNVEFADTDFLLRTGLVCEFDEFIQRQIAADFFRRAAATGAQQVKETARGHAERIAVFGVARIESADGGTGFGGSH